MEPAYRYEPQSRAYLAIKERPRPYMNPLPFLLGSSASAAFSQRAELVGTTILQSLLTTLLYRLFRDKRL